MNRKLFPRHLFRPSDGERWTHKKGGFYTMDTSLMQPKYETHYESLIRNRFTEQQPKQWRNAKKKT